MSTVPASQFVNVTPSVLAAAGTALSLSGLFLTQNTRVPIGAILQFPSALSVGNYFGLSSSEYTASQVYFNGFSISTTKPGNLVFTQYPSSAVAAYLRGGSVASLTLAQLQAISGSLTIVFDGFSRTAASINLSGASSFSSAASTIQTGLNGSIAASATVTGSVSGTTLTVTAVLTGTIALGLTVTGGTGIVAGTYVASQLTGTANGTGTYQLNQAGSALSQTITMTPTNVAVTYDSTSGAFVVTSGIVGAISTSAYATGTIASSLMFTQGSGAVLSQGAAAAIPGTFMATLIQSFQNWASFKTLFDPDGGSGNTQKLAFATWNNTTNNRYTYVCADTDVTPTLSVPATASLGYLLAQSNISGTQLIYEPAGVSGLHGADFICGCIASLNFNQLNGRATFAYLTQSGLQAGVTNQGVLTNLIANGYNCVVATATAATNFVYYYPGSVSGAFTWADTYVNQIWMNNAFQLDLMELVTSIGSIPYNTYGDTLIETSLSGTIQQALSFGAIRSGITLSATQITAINNATGNTTAANTIANRGWYIQILPTPPATRQARGSPPITFWYTDGESVQTINLASVVLL
jgi:hypothetical protein